MGLQTNIDSGVRILDTEINPPTLDTSKLMSLEDIKNEEDLSRWRDHNQRVALYLSNMVRHELFETGTPWRDAYLTGQTILPPEIQSAMSVWESLHRKNNPVDFSLDIEDGEDEVTIISRSWHEIIPENLRHLQALKGDQEIDSHVMNFVANALGVPLITEYTAENREGLSAGGHARALVRTPYQLSDGTWAYDVMDPLQMHATIGLPIPGVRTRSEAYTYLQRRVFANSIGEHILSNKVSYNLLQKLSGTPAYDAILHSSISHIQNFETVNCQFMSLLILAYLHTFYDSLYDQTGESIPGGGIGKIIQNQFEETFNVWIKELYDAMAAVGPFPITKRIL